MVRSRVVLMALMSLSAAALTEDGRKSVEVDSVWVGASRRQRLRLFDCRVAAVRVEHQWQLCDRDAAISIRIEQGELVAVGHDCCS